jgi:metallophosphoesterase superfamily enzyme
VPARHDFTPWSPEEYIRLTVLTASGVAASETAARLNAEFHGGQRVRTEAAITNRRRKAKLKVGPKPTTPLPAAGLPIAREQEVERSEGEDGITAKALGTRIRTVEDLLAHIGADLTRFEVAESQATKYETAAKDPNTGQVTVTELHRVYVKLRPKAGPSVLEAVEALIAGAIKPRLTIRPALIKPKANNFTKAAVMQALVIADPHVGKYAWGQETGDKDYDINIATRLIRNAAAELLEDGAHRQVGRRTILLLGDYFHYDTPHGQTTKGTPQDRDGRVDKMLEAGSQALFDLIETAAQMGPTEVVLVPGNHDAVLSVALRQMLTAYFRGDKRVLVEAGKTTRKYLTHGKCLLGLTHGDKAKKRLGELMAAEVPQLWGQSTYREIHTGHLHGEAEVQTVAGVVIRTAPALCPPDGWHATEGYVGKPRGMQAFYYHPDGALLGMTVSNPDRGH